jgi:hypothetical protein
VLGLQPVEPMVPEGGLQVRAHLGPVALESPRPALRLAIVSSQCVNHSETVGGRPGSLVTP